MWMNADVSQSPETLALNWRAQRAILEAALEVHGQEREDLLTTACGQNQAMLAQLRTMLADAEGHTAVPEPPTAVSADHVMMLGNDGYGSTLVGSKVGDFRITRLLGSGGMGEVYEAEQDQPKRVVALKILTRTTPHLVRRFRHEAETLARLGHPNIARVILAGLEHDQSGRTLPFIAMEYVSKARTLQEFADEQSLCLRDRVSRFIDVCKAVEHAHQRGVVHRDLKPANILVDEQGAVKVIDFGVSRLLDDSRTQLTMIASTPQLIGTLRYMAPEQSTMPHDVDSRADIYALGITLYELLCGGRSPFTPTGSSIAQAVADLQTQEPIDPRTANTEIDRGLGAVVLRAMNKDRAKRYASVTELTSDLDRWLRGDPVLATPPTTREQLQSFVRRHRALSAGLVGGVIALAIGAGTTTMFMLKARKEAARGERVAEFLSSALRESLKTNHQGTLKATNPISAHLAKASELHSSGGAQSDVNALRNQPSLSRMLNSAFNAIPTTFADDPLTGAEMTIAITRTMHANGITALVEYNAEDQIYEGTKLIVESFPRTDNRVFTAVTVAAPALAIGNRWNQALEFYELASEIALENFGPVDVRTVSLMLSAHNLNVGTGNRKRADQIAEQLLESLAGDNDLSRVLAAHADLTLSNATGINPIATTERAVGTFTSLNISTAALMRDALSTLVGQYRQAGRIADAERVLDQMTAVAWDDGVRCDGLATLDHAEVLLMAGRYEEVDKGARIYVANLAEKVAMNSSVMYKAYGWSARWMALAGNDLEEAARLGQRAAEGLFEIGDPGWAHYFNIWRATALRKLNRFDEARKLLNDCYDFQQSPGRKDGELERRYAGAAMHQLAEIEMAQSSPNVSQARTFMAESLRLNPLPRMPRTIVERQAIELANSLGLEINFLKTPLQP
jgi:serine/threonine protein kinase/tetratricopeptide (TPR) repeat protein